MKFESQFLEEESKRSPRLSLQDRAIETFYDRMERGDLSTEEDLHILENNKVMSVVDIGLGANGAKVVELKDDGSAILKFKKNEIEFRKFIEKGTYFRREVAAFEVARMLHYDAVPATTIRKVKRKIGSFQRKVQGAKNYGDIDYYAREKVPTADYIKMYIFDCIIFNCDRHDANVMVKDDKLVAIDNGLSFGNHGVSFWMNLLPGVIDSPVPDDFKNRLQELTSDKKLLAELYKKLIKYLKYKDAIACLSRIKNAVHVLNESDWIFTEDVYSKLKENYQYVMDLTGIIPEENVFFEVDLEEYSTTDKELIEAA